MLATLGLAFLLFLGGLEVDFARLRGRCCALAAGAATRCRSRSRVAGSLALGAAGLVETPLLVAIAPRLDLARRADPGAQGRRARSSTTLGQLVIAGGLDRRLRARSSCCRCSSPARAAPGATLVLIGALLGAGAGRRSSSCAGAERSHADPRRPAAPAGHDAPRSACAARWSCSSASRPPREQLGLEVILGAFAAGAILVARRPRPAMTHPDFRRKLEAIGFGVFIPVFFVTSGVRFDLDALLAGASTLAMVPLFLAALLVVRGLPALLYRRLVGAPRDAGRRAAAGDLAAVPRRRHGDRAASSALIGAGEGAALVGAGLLSVLLFPAAGLALLRSADPRNAGRGHRRDCASMSIPAPIQQFIDRQAKPPPRAMTIFARSSSTARSSAHPSRARRRACWRSRAGSSSAWACRSTSSAPSTT